MTSKPTGKPNVTYFRTLSTQLMALSGCSADVRAHAVVAGLPDLRKRMTVMHLGLAQATSRVPAPGWRPGRRDILTRTTIGVLDTPALRLLSRKWMRSSPRSEEIGGVMAIDVVEPLESPLSFIRKLATNWRARRADDRARDLQCGPDTASAAATAG